MGEVSVGVHDRDQVVGGHKILVRAEAQDVRDRVAGGGGVVVVGGCSDVPAYQIHVRLHRRVV